MRSTDLRAVEQPEQSVRGGLSGVTEGGVVLERQVGVGQAEKPGLDPMNDQEGSCPMCIPERTPKSPEEGVETRTGWRGCSNNTQWEGVHTCEHTGPRVSITKAPSWAPRIQHLETQRG